MPPGIHLFINNDTHVDGGWRGRGHESLSECRPRQLIHGHPHEVSKRGHSHRRDGGNDSVTRIPDTTRQPRPVSAWKGMVAVVAAYLDEDFGYCTPGYVAIGCHDARIAIVDGRLLLAGAGFKPESSREGSALGIELGRRVDLAYTERMPHASVKRSVFVK